MSPLHGLEVYEVWFLGDEGVINKLAFVMWHLSNCIFLWN